MKKGNDRLNQAYANYTDQMALQATQREEADHRIKLLEAELSDLKDEMSRLVSRLTFRDFHSHIMKKFKNAILAEFGFTDYRTFMAEFDSYDQAKVNEVKRNLDKALGVEFTIEELAELDEMLIQWHREVHLGQRSTDSFESLRVKLPPDMQSRSELLAKVHLAWSLRRK
mmetsp:Transcript_13220/g.24751  ORF Transcript_13220/g.24751 Transcript_13220/m.24751 type:complete len:170 (+) Transcript_13220:144-653(+)